MSTSNERRYHHGDLKETLLRVAEQLLDEGGPAAVGLREAARRAGVSPTAPYRHFADKEALLAALAAEGFKALGSALRDAASAQSGGLFRMGEAYVRFALARPGRFRLMFSQSAANMGQDATLTEAARGAFAALGAAIGTPATSPIRDEMEARVEAIRAWAYAHGLAHLLLDGMLPPAETDRWIGAFFSPTAALPPRPGGKDFNAKDDP